MNKIYKVVWSKVRNAYIVVSELAKRNSKTKSQHTSRVPHKPAAAGRRDQSVLGDCFNPNVSGICNQCLGDY